MISNGDELDVVSVTCTYVSKENKLKIISACGLHGTKFVLWRRSN